MYYLVIYSYVCLNQNGPEVLFYNTLDQSYFITKPSMVICKEIDQLINESACVTISHELFNNVEFKKLLRKIELKNMGFIECASYFKEKPFSPPLELISKDNEEIIFFNRPKHLVENIREVTIYLNNYSDSNYLNINTVMQAYKQFNYTMINNELNSELDIKALFKFINAIPKYVTLNFLGGNILNYKNLSILLNSLLDSSYRVKLHVHYMDLLELADIDIIELLCKFHIIVFIDFPISIEIIKEIKDKLKNANYKLNFIVENDSDFEFSERIIGDFNFSSYNHTPFFNGKNLSFFKKNVYINKTDLFQVKHSIVELLINKTSNPHYFGKLILNSDGNLFTSFHRKPLINVEEFIENIEIIINKLIIDYDSDWIQNKPKLFPCNKCIYNFLCTPLSNYEKVIGKNNLCTLVK